MGMSRFFYPAIFALLAALPWSLGLEAAQAEGLPPSALPYDDDTLSAYADLTQQWGTGVEAVIESSYRECFRTLFIGGNILTLRLPFAEESERSELADSDLKVSGSGKAEPGELWESIERILASGDFSAYIEALSDGREKLIQFDMPSRTWSAKADRFAVERMLSGPYPGLPHRPVVLSEGKGASVPQIYDYLYCVGRVGIDCSGFVWHILRAVGKEGGIDLDAILRREAGLPRGIKSSLFVGTVLFDPRSGRTRRIADEIDKLLPGDILLFRGEDGSFIHSCVVQSIDLANGRLRYLQSTDECPRDERGVHDSLLLFDPSKPGTSLKDPSLRWLQFRGAAFEGEPAPAFANDGERFRAYADKGGGIVVRLKALEKTIAKLRAQKPNQPVLSPRE